MPAGNDQILYEIEVHSPEGIRRYFEQGGSPNDWLNDGMPLFTMMVEMYTRSPRFKECVQAFIDHGVQFDLPALLAVFTDDAVKLEQVLKVNPTLISQTYSRFNNTYTPLLGATLLHFCAEYNSINCAELLVSHGADINARAGFDEYGFGGHTPIFHTVNQNSNNSKDVMKFLLDQGADLSVSVKGLIWGKGYEWETFIPAVNPISYAMMGLLPQMHRKDITVAETVSVLMKYAYGMDYMPPNVPNAYLK
ncbi:ankyrin repeat domain-containing protein [Mucilaginibacter sp.]|uniref:ankyrin repeat domain-containing protein n=1 Tax=Mucilaginibacter sp. TaxID=1882438 RepID=UPI002BB87A41|nr:ankyrin repeat domain-containing protein [Mucilaginibacter sp.]HTI61303.1 ankyrin repeat domain-containing protein [Mucilaginibacter sp.]